VSALLEYWPVVGFVINLLIAWFFWSMRKQFASKDELAEIERRLDKTESTLNQLPTRRDLTELHVAMAGIAGGVKETNAELRGLGRLVERVENAVTRHEEIFANAARGQK
jgi:hypothetical protein